jgi:RNA polymerase sigma-70 factor (ECF subfamily)
VNAAAAMRALCAMALVAPPARSDRDVDDAIVTRHRGGDPAAFGDLYRRHVDAVYRRLTRLIGPVPERDDLTQDVFLGLYKALPTFRGDAALSTLLYRIAVNTACEHLRRRMRRKTVPLDAVPLDELVAPDATPEVAARRREEVARLLTCLDRIKPKKRIALVLRVVEGMAFEEIAELVDATPEAVAKRVQHGMRELSDLLARAELRGAP